MPKKILAVDDEGFILRLIGVNLEKEGYQVITAADGEEALEKSLSEKPDLIILDVMMPVMDGYETLRRLRENKATAAIPVVMLTAKSQDSDVFKGWQSGADLYLTKPFNRSELVSFIKRIFQGQSSQKSEYDLTGAEVIDMEKIDETLLSPPHG
jgi:two-component system alkaline phosphatase synthesis response regulator PhoP/two-component system response regulator VicR